MELYYETGNELYHHGIKGMKWGVRRYQNKDGTLTPAGRKRVSKEYKKLSEKGSKKLSKRFNEQYMDSYNEAADYMNREGISKFNQSQRNKYGENYSKRDGYEDDYFEEFNNLVAKNFDKRTNEFYKNDPDVKKGRELVKKYDMTKWDDLARKNEAAIEQVRTSVEENSATKSTSNKKSEQKRMIKDMIDNYDMSDPDAEEALELLRELERDL